MLKAQLGEIHRAWAEYGVRHPVFRKLLVFSLVMMLFCLCAAGIVSRLGYDSLPSIMTEKEKTA